MTVCENCGSPQGRFDKRYGITVCKKLDDCVKRRRKLEKDMWGKSEENTFTQTDTK